MKLKHVALACAVLLAGVAQAVAAPVYVGSWTVDQGPTWEVTPPAYTGQEAAALLFGGSPSDYVISTLGIDPANIDFSNWVSVFLDDIGNGTQIVAQNFKVGAFYADQYDTSAYVADAALGDTYTNYAFRVEDGGGPGSEAPIPAVGAGLPGLILIGGAALKWMRRRRPVVSA